MLTFLNENECKFKLPHTILNHILGLWGPQYSEKVCKRMRKVASGRPKMQISMLWREQQRAQNKQRTPCPELWAHIYTDESNFSCRRFESVRQRDKIWRLSLLNQQRSGQSQQHFGTRRRELRYLLDAGANPLTANLLNFITLSLTWEWEYSCVCASQSFEGGFFLVFRRTTRPTFCAVRGLNLLRKNWGGLGFGQKLLKIQLERGY